jgi:endoglucanase
MIRDGPRLGRRALACGGLLLAGTSPAAPQTTMGSAAEDWNDFRRRFLAPEGRIVDTGNRNVSHTEGQGYAMLAAVRADDQGSFARMLNWTLGNLKRRGDELCSWRFQPDAQTPVTDPNNATDGDLFIAWSLIEAGRRWRNTDYRRRGVAIGRDILRLCTVRVGPALLLLPGAYGFQARGKTVINPSYYIFPALLALQEETNDPAWERLTKDGLEVLRQARFGRWSLPPDWLEIRHEDMYLIPAPNWPARFSFDAIRVPLNLVWGGEAQHPAVSSCLGFWTSPDHRAMPAWTDLRTAQLAPYPASSGVVGIARLCGAALGTRGQAAAMPRIGNAPDYFAAALVMQARLAWRQLTLA